MLASTWTWGVARSETRDADGQSALLLASVKPAPELRVTLLLFTTYVAIHDARRSCTAESDDRGPAGDRSSPHTIAG